MRLDSRGDGQNFEVRNLTVNRPLENDFGFSA